MEKISINLYELLLSLSNAQDLVSAELANHHQQVAYLAYYLAEQAVLSIEQQKDIVLAALTHDIGALSKEERLELIESEPINASSHAFRGAKLLEEFSYLQKAANIVRYHHLPWNHGEGRTYQGRPVPYASHLLHLADRACAALRRNQNPLTQLPNMLATIQQRESTVFPPELVQALLQLEQKEYIWMTLFTDRPVERLSEVGLFDTLVLDIDGVVELAMLFSHIIDFRSSFTAWHSAGVAETAEQLARIMGFSTVERKMMRIAGYLHDLGKLAVDRRLLEKNGALSDEEFCQVRAHAYYTYYLLSAIPQFQIINIWASYHHERLDGKGYPFHIHGDNLPLGSRIMAVADVFTAIAEDRPYRPGMEEEDVRRALTQMVANGALDQKVVEALLNHYPYINQQRILAQQQAAERYSKFLTT